MRPASKGKQSGDHQMTIGTVGPLSANDQPHIKDHRPSLGRSTGRLWAESRPYSSD